MAVLDFFFFCSRSAFIGFPVQMNVPILCVLLSIQNNLTKKNIKKQKAYKNTKQLK